MNRMEPKKLNRIARKGENIDVHHKSVVTSKANEKGSIFLMQNELLIWDSQKSTPFITCNLSNASKYNSNAIKIEKKNKKKK